MSSENTTHFHAGRPNYWGPLLILFTLLSCTSDPGPDPMDGEPPEESLYFPENSGNAWEEASLDELGWNDTAVPALNDFLEATNTKGFLVLVGGRIALESYFNGHDQNKLWYWASAGKTLSCMAVGIAQQEGFLDLDDPSSDHLGAGWTSADPEQEAQIRIWNQLTMTTGLDEAEFDCTSPSCLKFVAPAGSRWSYHNGPYTLLQSVVSSAVGEDFDAYFDRKIRTPLGMNGFWFDTAEGGRTYYSNTRSMARFGLCVLAEGSWEGTEILSDNEFFEEMKTPSQSLNESYGYLWWLNGQDSYMAPVSQFRFQGPLIPAAPADLFAGLGKNDQKVYVIPSLDMVVVRMGEDPGGNALAVSDFDNELWTYLNAVLGR